MICPYCKEEILEGAILCKHCKSSLTTSNTCLNSETKTFNDEQIRHELKKYDEFVELKCLECGYVGDMGVIQKVVPWYFTWWVLIPVLLTGIGTIPAIGLGICRYISTKHRVVCPSCKEVLLHK